MNLKWSCVILNLLVIVRALSETEINAHIELTGLGYEDYCKKAGGTEWDFIKKPNNETLTSWENAVKEYANYKREQNKDIANVTNGILVKESIIYEYNLVSKPGDALLDSKEWDDFGSFVGEAQYLKLSRNNTEAEKILTHKTSSDEKLKTWKTWYADMKPLAAKFSQSLKHLQNAAIANGESDTQTYWELLCNFNDGYSEAKEKWNEISPLYSRIVKFVGMRLESEYGKDVINTTIPAHLLGSLQGYDWTPLAIDVIPHPDMTFNIMKNLLEKELVGEKLYKSASNLGNEILKHVPVAEFWNSSDFKAQCPSRLINFCRKESMRLSTCSQLSLANYLSAHKNVAKVLFYQMSEQSNPILNEANRYSALEEGVAEFFGILAASPAWLRSIEIANETDDMDQARIVSLIITALDVFPRMAYYLAADTWRIDSIKNNTFDEDHLMSSWWEYRSEFQNIRTDSTDVPTFLDDDYIISNRPYLSKFMGILLGFQIYEWLMDSTEIRYEKIESISLKHQLVNMIRDGSADNWHEVVKKYLQFEEVSADPLINFFAPLDLYFDEIESDEVTLTPTSIDLKVKLENLQNKYQEYFDNPTTVPPITTTTTTTTPKPVKSKKKNETHENILNDQVLTNPLSPDENKKSKVESESIKVDATEATKITFETGEKNDKKIKTGTSKAVWAVGAVLIATIAIIIIGIFGTRRCRKTPKNRRYV